jgi:Flp pilus assembly protein TadG
MGSIEKRRSSKEGGSVAVFCLIILGLFLTLTAFAVDVGSMYLWRVRVDKAARAAALAGLGYRTTVGFVKAQQNKSALATQATNAAMYNLGVYGANTAAPTLTTNVDYNPGGNGRNETVKVDLTYQASTFLVGRLSGIFGFSLSGGSTSVKVTSSQSASLNPAYVAIVVDVSGSMFCPAVDADTSDTCACRRTNTCVFKGSKLEKMVNGLSVFTDSFNPNTDYLSIIPFNLGAWTAFSMIDSSSGEPTPFGNRSAAFRKVLMDINTYAGSNTNHCDALAQTINEFNQLALSSKMRDRAPSMIRPYVLFFTDGAPNAFRGIFNRNELSDTALHPTVSDFDQHNYSNVPAREKPGPGKVDLYHYAIEWYDQGSPDKREVDRTYRGPSPFVVRGANSDGTPNVWKLPIGGNSIVPLTNPTDATSRYPHCGSETSDPKQFIKTVKSSSATSQDGCLKSSSFSFDIPYTGVSLNSTIPKISTVKDVAYETTDLAKDPTWPTTSTQSEIQLYDQLPYYCAIEAADYIRSTFGGTIFTIGLGPGALATDKSNGQPSASCADPLQDANDHVSRKDSFLTRLAYAEPVAGNSVAAWQLFRQARRSVAISNCLSHRYTSLKISPSVGYTSSVFTDDDAGNGLDPSLKPTKQGDDYKRKINTKGGYYPTPDANQLPSIFGAVAKSILLRLAS